MSAAAPAPTEPAAVAERVPARRTWRRALAAVALVVLGFVGWHHLVELPAERRAAVELAKQRAANARTIPDLKLDLVWIAPGTFRMGTPEQNFLARWFYDAREKLTKQPNLGNSSQPNERPVTWVTLTRPFWLGRTEVTQAQWTAVMGYNHSNSKGADQPVEEVTWDNAMEFCRKLTERERAAGRLPARHAFTLPTEAQWEYACRAGTTGDYAGDLNTMAWWAANNGGTIHAVGTKRANAWGLADMHGNVWEWCLDWKGAYPGGEVTNPRGPSSGSDRVARGGGWDYGAGYLRSADRNASNPSPPDSRSNSHGFRVALSFSP